jgi:glucoamylase
MERFANEGTLLPEQVWDDASNEPNGFRIGSPTGSAVPLLWAHAEYVKLLRSIADGKCFDLMPEVESRYASRPLELSVEMWTFEFPTQFVRAGQVVRIYARRPFRLHLSFDNWSTVDDLDAIDVPLGMSYVDVTVPEKQNVPLRFTFFWKDTSGWQRADYSIRVQPHEDKQ